MAELLIKARDASHDDPETDRVGCYKRGDVVVVQSDGHVWGAKEGLPNFVVLKIPGVSVAIVEDLTQTQTDDDSGNPVLDVDGSPKPHRRRAWRLAVASIPAAIRNQLVNNGVATVTPAQIRNYVKRIRDNVKFPKL